MTDAEWPTGDTEEDPTDTSSSGQDDSLGELVADLSSQARDLIRREVELAVTELKEELPQAAKAGGMLGAGAISGYFALLFGSLALAWLLDRRLPRWFAFGLVAAMHGAAAATLLARGREEMLEVDPVPRQTVETLKDDVEMIRGVQT